MYCLEACPEAVLEGVVYSLPLAMPCAGLEGRGVSSPLVMRGAERTLPLSLGGAVKGEAAYSASAGWEREGLACPWAVAVEQRVQSSPMFPQLSAQKHRFLVLGMKSLMLGAKSLMLGAESL